MARASRGPSGISLAGAEPGLLRTGLSADAVDVAVAEIRQLSRVAAMELALGIGEIIFKRIYGSDLELLRKTGPKHVSFRQLALHPEVPVSASVLWRSVATYELAERLPVVKDSRHLGITHVREVLALPPKHQEKLLTRADREGWTVAELMERVKRRRKGHGGRPPKHDVLRALDTLFRVSTLPISAFSDRKAIAKLSQEEIVTGLAALQELGERLQRLEKTLLDVQAVRE